LDKWCEENWGTRKNMIDAFVEEDGSMRFTSFITPPSVAMWKLSNLFPSIKIELRYMLNDNYYGCYIFQKGMETHVVNEDPDLTFGAWYSKYFLFNLCNRSWDNLTI
jgi:hypothetical protein